MPDLSGKTRGGASNILKERGLELGQVEETYSDTVAKGRVISQDPAPGTTIDQGSKVNIVLSLGPETTEAPPETTPEPTPEQTTPEPDTGEQEGSSEEAGG